MKTILNWNIYMGGGTRVPSILDSITEISPDILILTEFRNNQRGAEVKTGLQKAGLLYYTTAKAEPNENSVAIFSRTEFTPLRIEGDLQEIEKRVIGGTFENCNIIAWYYPQSWLRDDYLKFTMHELSEYLKSPTLLIGDFNVGCIGSDGFTGKYGAVENSFSDTTQIWCDTWRSRHQNKSEYSWYSHAGNGFRIDHILGSESANKLVDDVWYQHDVRKNKVSDHSQMLCTISSL